jgi:hypothetical protein
VSKYVIKSPDGRYVRSRYSSGELTDDINKARIFSNVASAKASYGWPNRSWQAPDDVPEGWRVVAVTLLDPETLL